MSHTKTQYTQWLKQLKEQIYSAQLHTHLQVNAGMLALYWYIGNEILIKQEREGWGTKIIDRLATDLVKAFPNIAGFSARNIQYMRQFAKAYSNILITQQPVAQIDKKIKSLKPLTVKHFNDPIFTQQLVAQIPWSHHVVLMDKVEDTIQRLWYMQQTIINTWSRNVLVHMIETDLYKRQYKIKKLTNFKQTLPAPQSELAEAILKDPYHFDFLQLAGVLKEKDLEGQLIEHLAKFLLELGNGFAFVGRQVRIKVAQKEYFIDLLFYHLHLRSYVIIDLKMDEFIPEYAGKMNFYCNVINKQYRGNTDNPTVGIILCKSKNNIEVEFALSNMTQPIGVAAYKMMKSLPLKFRGKLPSAELLEKEIKKFNKRNKR